MSATLGRGAWYAEGLRWIAGGLNAVAERLDRPSPELAPLEPMPRITPRDEALHELRNRLTNTW
jgi:hypothetical protein